MENDNSPVLVASKLVKSFGRTPVLTGLSCEFWAGEVSLLLGQNGAGKSTLLRLLAGLAVPEQGEIRYSGPPSTERRVNYYGHALMLYGACSVFENLCLYAALLNTGTPQVEEALVRWGLSSVRDTEVNALSKGLQSRVSLARAFLVTSPLVLLDEPTSALDDRGVEVLCQVLSAVRAGESRPTIIIATHDIHRLSAVAQRVIVLAGGGVGFDSRGMMSSGVVESSYEVRVRAAVQWYQGVNR